MHKYPFTAWKMMRRRTAAIGILLAAYAPHVLAAQPNAATSIFPNGTESVITNVVTWVISGLDVLMWILFIFLSYLLDPNFIFNGGNNGNFLIMLNRIWQLSRDLMNVAFAFILVGAAIYTIVTANKEYIAAHYKKFFAAVILVNFSWFFPQVILDVANVATATIYGIPSVLQTDDSFKCTTNIEIPATATPDIPNCTQGQLILPDAPSVIGAIRQYSCPCQKVRSAEFFVDNDWMKEHNDNMIQAGGDKAPPVDGEDSYWKCYGNIVCLRYGPLDLKTTAGQSAILNGLFVNEANMGNLATIPQPVQADSVQEAIVFIVRQIIVLVIHIALFFPLAALVLAFTIRIPVLWLTMAFMPFIFLSFVVDQSFITEYPKKLWDSFLKAAFLPAMVAVPFAVGFIMLSAGTAITTGTDTIKIPILSQIGTFTQLIWLMMSIGIIWVGVFTVLEGAGIMGKGASFIRQQGEALGRFALKAPLAVPFLPGPANSKVTPLAMMNRLKPTSLEHAISGDQGIGGLGGFLAGNAQANRNQHNQNAAAKMAEEPEKLNELHRDLESLKRLLENEGTTDEQIKQALTDIKNKHDVDLHMETFKDDMKHFTDELHNKGGDDAKLKPTNDDIIKKLEERKKAPAPGGGAPTP